MADHHGVKYSKVIQKIQSLTQPIEKVIVGKQHVYALSKAGEYFYWGMNHSGLALKSSKSIFDIPQSLPSLSYYGFSDMITSADHTLALGSSVKLSFTFKDMPDSHPFTIHALHIFDERTFPEGRLELESSLTRIQMEDVEFLNDFDVPYISLKGIKYPKLKKLKRKRREAKRDDDDDDDEEEEEEEEDDDDEAGDNEDGEDEEDEDKSEKAGEEDEDGKDSNEDDEEDEEIIAAKKKAAEAEAKKKNKEKKKKGGKKKKEKKEKKPKKEKPCT